MELAPGCRVRLQGLTSEAGQLLNGKCGVAGAFVADKDRWAVTLEDGEQKTFKKENLEVTAAPSPAIDSEAEMMATMRGLGMPESVIANLTMEQKAQMLKMTQDPAILAKAQATMAAANNSAGPAVEGRSADPTALTKAADGSHSWRDDKEEVHVEVNCPYEGKINCDFEIQAMNVSVDGNMLFTKTLFQEVDVPACNWQINVDGTQRVLMVTLKKKQKMRWVMLTR